MADAGRSISARGRAAGHAALADPAWGSGRGVGGDAARSGRTVRTAGDDAGARLRTLHALRAGADAWLRDRRRHVQARPAIDPHRGDRRARDAPGALCGGSGGGREGDGTAAGAAERGAVRDDRQRRGRDGPIWARPARAEARRAIDRGPACRGGAGEALWWVQDGVMLISRTFIKVGCRFLPTAKILSLKVGAERIIGRRRIFYRPPYVTRYLSLICLYFRNEAK